MHRRWSLGIAHLFNRQQLSDEDVIIDLLKSDKKINFLDFAINCDWAVKVTDPDEDIEVIANFIDRKRWDQIINDVAQKTDIILTEKFSRLLKFVSYALPSLRLTVICPA